MERTFIEGLEAGVDALMDKMREAFGEIADQAAAREKGTCVFFQFSLLRYDLLSGRAVVRLDVMDGSWYLDRAPLYAELDLTFLFRPYLDRQEELLTGMRSYMGKVNRYDVYYIVQEEIMAAVRILTQFLRLLFRGIETLEAFRRIPRPAFWEISFGEYRDNREVIVQVNREAGREEVWLERLEDTKEDPGLLQFTWWYQVSLMKGDCREKRLEYIVFEECSLENLDFEQAGMAGARFLRCNMENCSFRNTDLTQAEFDRCSFTDCDFTGAGLMQAVFSPEGLEAGWFDEKQREEILIAEGVEV